MKIKPQHFKELKAAIEPLHNKERWEIYQAQGLSAKRYRWDLLYASKLKIGDGKGCSGLPLYAYMNDDHIDTALRAIVC